MKSLILLQGFALGGAVTGQTHFAEHAIWAAIALVVVCPLIWFGLKAVWPKDKW